MFKNQKNSLIALQIILILILSGVKGTEEKNLPNDDWMDLDVGQVWCYKVEKINNQAYSQEVFDQNIEEIYVSGHDIVFSGSSNNYAPVSPFDGLPGLDLSKYQVECYILIDYTIETGDLQAHINLIKVNDDKDSKFLSDLGDVFSYELKVLNPLLCLWILNVDISKASDIIERSMTDSPDNISKSSDGQYRLYYAWEITYKHGNGYKYQRNPYYFNSIVLSLDQNRIIFNYILLIFAVVMNIFA